MQYFLLLITSGAKRGLVIPVNKIATCTGYNRIQPQAYRLVIICHRANFHRYRLKWPARFYAGFRAGAEWLYQGGLRQTVKSINRFDVYNNNFLEFRYLYYLLKPVVTSNLLPFRRFCALNNFINTIIDYMVWIFIFLQSLVLYQLIVKDNKVLKEE